MPSLTVILLRFGRMLYTKRTTAPVAAPARTGMARSYATPIWKCKHFQIRVAACSFYGAPRSCRTPSARSGAGLSAALVTVDRIPLLRMTPRG